MLQNLMVSPVNRHQNGIVSTGILLARDPVVKMLLDAGADVDLVDAKNQSPLMIATQLGQLQCVAALVQKRADVRQRDEQDSTALYWAIYEGHDDIARLLIRNGADLRQPTNGYTPLHWAKAAGRDGIAQMLVAAGVRD
jgi:ankyrin repeat protein